MIFAQNELSFGIFIRVYNSLFASGFEIVTIVVQMSLLTEKSVPFNEDRSSLQIQFLLYDELRTTSIGVKIFLSYMSETVAYFYSRFSKFKKQTKIF